MSRRSAFLACLLALAVALGAGRAGTARGDGAAARWRLAFATEIEGRRGLDVYVVDVPGGRPRRVAGVAGRNDFSPTWSSDGRTIAFRRNPARGDEGEILVVPASGGRGRNLTRSPGVADWSPAWSPSGRELAYFSTRGGGRDLWLMQKDGTRNRRLTRDASLNEYPSFRPDGASIAFQSYRTGDFDIFVMSRTGTRQRNLSRHPAGDKWPAWSPDGGLIAFASDRNGSEDVYVMRSDGADVANVTDTTALQESHPSWAPDGRLTFTRRAESGPIELGAVEADGSNPERLDTVAAPVFAFDWLKPGARVAMP